jgi:hypothetical protein
MEYMDPNMIEDENGLVVEDGDYGNGYDGEENKNKKSA